MKNNSNLTKYLFLIFIIINIPSGAFLLEYDLISNKTDLKPLSIISKDNICQTYIPSLFSPIPLLKNGEYKDLNPLLFEIKIKNPMIAESVYDMFLGNIIDDNINIILGVKNILAEQDVCYFGLSSGLEKSIDPKEINNTLEYLKINNKIDEKKFSLDKWDLNLDKMIKSKLYLGYNHKDFNSQNKKYIGTCQNIKEDSYWGCYFNQMIFNNTIIPLNKSDDQNYKIYFASEDYIIRFPKIFKDILLKASDDSCTYENKQKKMICNDWFKKDSFIPLTLSNDNMDITLEIDNSKRYKADGDQNSIDMIFSEDIENIIFPLKMLKNFHIQFDAEENIIRFYSTDKNILDVKINDSQQENNSSYALTVFLVILIIIILLGLGFGIFYYIKKRKSGNSTEINKFTKFEDEDDFKNMQEKKIY